MNIKRLFFCFYIPVLLAGCSAFDIDGQSMNSRTIKAENRMLLVTDKAPILLKDKSGGVVIQQKRVVCAEPSPDAMTALAMSGALKAPIFGKEVEVSGAMNQSISELGERTPVIQMLRDSLYRACEAHMNGMLNEQEYQFILKFFDVYSVTVMAIEDLTRVSRAPVILSSGANAKINADKSQEASVTPAAGSSSQTVTTDKTGVAKEVNSILCNYYQLKFELIKGIRFEKLIGKLNDAIKAMPNNMGSNVEVRDSIAEIKNQIEKSSGSLTCVGAAKGS